MKLLAKLKSETQNLHLAMSALLSKTKNKVENDVPYISQFAHPQYAEKILKNGIAKTKDPHWKNTGAESPQEYAAWVLNICGMACFAMALQYFKSRKIGIVTLAKDAKNHGVYRKQSGKLSDMYYKEFSNWVKDYEFEAQIYTKLGIRGLQKLLSDGSLVIVSVNPNIRGYKTAHGTQRGGHLVLVTGFDKKKHTLTLHNPSGFISKNTQQNHTISILEFLKYYAGRGIALLGT